MPDLHELPTDAWARIERVKLEAARARAKAIKVARAELTPTIEDYQRSEILKSIGINWDAGASKQDLHRDALIFAHVDYLAPVFFAAVEEFRKIKGAALGVHEIDQIFDELCCRSCLTWLESGGDAEDTQYFLRRALAAVKNDTRYPNLLGAMVSSRPNHEAESAASVAAGKETARNPVGASESQRRRKGDVTLLQDPAGKLKRAVSPVYAARYLGVTPRHIQRLVSGKKCLTVVGGGQNKQILVNSLLEYLPPPRKSGPDRTNYDVKRPFFPGVCRQCMI